MLHSHRPRAWRSQLACAALAMSGLLAPAAVAQRLGSEFRVNTYTQNNQINAAVGVRANGDFVIVWASEEQDGYNRGIFGRRFSSAGAALATEFQINSYTNNAEHYPAVASGTGGDFVVAWQSFNQEEPLNYGVFGQRFSSAGTALASEFQVNTYTPGTQKLPSVTTLASGTFIITWESFFQDDDEFGIFARRYTSAGAVATEFQVNTHTLHRQASPVAAAGASGDFVVVWHSIQDGGSLGVFAQRFSSAGTALASEFQVNTYTNTTQSFPAVAAAGSGDFVVVWSSYGQDGYNFGIFGQRFSSAGVALATEFQVNTHTDSAEELPKVAAGTDGDFVVVWESLNQDGLDFGIFGRLFSSAGAPLASEFQVNTYSGFAQRYPQVGAAASGDFVVAWHSDTQDGSDNGIFAQRFATPKLIDIDGDGVVMPLTDGLLVLRSTFGFTGAVLTSGAVNLSGCTRCDASAIESYLKTLN